MPSMYENLPPLSVAAIERGRRKVPNDYPSADNKFRIDQIAWNAMLRSGEIVIPEGPWSIVDHPNRKDKPVSPIHTISNPMPSDQAQRWREQGLKTDSVGRPLHPYAAQLLPTLGMFTQPGKYWHYGPQAIGNFGLRRVRGTEVSYAVVAVDRGEARPRLGIAGGHGDSGESIQEAATRELWQETGVRTANLGRLVMAEYHALPQCFWGTTLHAWTEEGYVFAQSQEDPGLSDVELSPIDTSEVVDAFWMNLEQISEHPDFLGAHRTQIFDHEERLRASS